MIKKENNLIIFCDFDGTITKEDTTDLILNFQSNKRWENIGKLYLSGMLTHGQMNILFANMVKLSARQINALLKQEVHIREGFNELIEFSRKNNIPFVIISGGWDYYIKKILKKYNLKQINLLNEIKKINAGTISLISNNFTYSYKNKNWNLNLLWEENGCKYSSPCKASVIKLLTNKKIIVIGNSESDICMAKEADLVFSTGGLSNFCKKNKIKYQHFNSFKEVQKKIDNLLII